MNGIEAFVRARLADRDLPDQVTRTYTDLLELSVTIRSDGESDDWISWLTAPSAIVKIGEYALGADPDSVAKYTVSVLPTHDGREPPTLGVSDMTRENLSVAIHRIPFLELAVVGGVLLSLVFIDRSGCGASIGEPLVLAIGVAFLLSAILRSIRGGISYLVTPVRKVNGTAAWTS